MNPRTPPNVELGLRVTYLRTNLHALSYDLATQRATAEQLRGTAERLESLAVELREYSAWAPSRGPRLLAGEDTDA